jgi:hypothetical protein
MAQTNQRGSFGCRAFVFGAEAERTRSIGDTVECMAATTMRRGSRREIRNSQYCEFRSDQAGHD